jgi:hypothetical protein
VVYIGGERSKRLINRVEVVKMRGLVERHRCGEGAELE